MSADLREELPDDAYLPSVDVCSRCGDCYCDGIACIAELDPDAVDDREAVEEVQDLLRLGQAWQIMERHGLAVAVRALDHAGYATPLRSATTGIEMMAAERLRHVAAEGWTPEHDDEHETCEMAMAAVAYVIEAIDDRNAQCWLGDAAGEDGGPVPAVAYWPWDLSWWKPAGPIRNLVKAGSLIAGELDRLLRAAASTSSPQGGGL